MSLAWDTGTDAAASPSHLAEVIRGGHIRTVFQPIVALDGLEIVAYEALTRGPDGVWESPMALFAQARREGLLSELDAVCRATAVRTAHDTGVLAPLGLFVNVEPEVLDCQTIDDLVAIVEQGPADVRMVVEITERALAARPAELFTSVERIHELGWGVALDDVGTSPSSLAFMALLRPDVVKLDLSMIQDRPSLAQAKIMHAVNAYAESTGALVLAEGIETESHLAVARGLGATFGQGWHFGRPTSEPRRDAEVRGLVLPDRPRAASSTSRRSPFACLPASVQVRRLPKRLLCELSKHLENQAAEIGNTCIIATAFQTVENFTPATVARYQRLVAQTGFVCVLGEDFEVNPVPGLRGMSLGEHDPMRAEWDIIVLSPHFATALLARDLGDSGAEMERRFDYALTYDRETVVRAALEILSRLADRDGAG